MFHKMQQPQPQQQPPKMQLNVPFDQLEDVVCECGGKIFIPALQFKKLSAILSPTGQEQMVMQEVMVCVKCWKDLGITKNVGN